MRFQLTSSPPILRCSHDAILTADYDENCVLDYPPRVIEMDQYGKPLQYIRRPAKRTSYRRFTVVVPTTQRKHRTRVIR